MRIIRQSSICIRRTARRPEIRRIMRSSALLRKHAIRGTVLSLVPSEVTDVVIHHAHLSVNEVVRVATDSLSTSAVGTALSITLTAIKYL